MALLEKERELKANCKKGKGYQEDYDKFLSTKEEKIKKIYSKKSQLEFTTLKREKTPKNETNIEGVDSKRLQSYGL